MEREREAGLDCSLLLLLCEYQFSLARDSQPVFLAGVQNHDFTLIIEQFRAGDGFG